MPVPCTSVSGVTRGTSCCIALCKLLQNPSSRPLPPIGTVGLWSVECLFTWYWRADLGAPEGMPFVLGHALSLQAIHGGKATNDTIDSHKIATLLRGGMLPQAYGSPAERPAPRDLLRRRMPLMRQRADRLSQVHNTTSQYNVPESGTTIAYTTHRAGVAERFAAPAVPKNLAVDLALITY